MTISSTMHETIADTYGHRMACYAMIVHAVQLSLPVLDTDLTGETSFSERISATVDKVMWNIPESERLLALKIGMGYHEYETRCLLEGLGGCIKLSLKDCIES